MKRNPETVFHFDLPEVANKFCNHCMTFKDHVISECGEWYTCTECGGDKWIPPFKRDGKSLQLVETDPDAGRKFYIKSGVLMR